MKHFKLITAFLLMGIIVFLSNCKKEDNTPLGAPPCPTVKNGEFDFEESNRTYEIHFPSNYCSSSDEYPLIIYLHSYTADFEWGKSYTAIQNIATAEGFILVGPEAIDETWNSGIGDNPEIDAPDVDDVGFINALIDTLINKYNIDPDRVYSCGFSNGANMSFKLACQLSDRLAAIGSVGGIMFNNTYDECNPQHPMPLIKISGTNDPFVNINGNPFYYSVDEALNYWSTINTCLQVDTVQLENLDPNDGCTVSKISFTDCENQSEIVYYKVINGGHTWPGALFEISVFGNRNMDIIASKEIVEFFKNYSLN